MPLMMLAAKKCIVLPGHAWPSGHKDGMPTVLPTPSPLETHIEDALKPFDDLQVPGMDHIKPWKHKTRDKTQASRVLRAGQCITCLCASCYWRRKPRPATQLAAFLWPSCVSCLWPLGPLQNTEKDSASSQNHLGICAKVFMLFSHVRAADSLAARLYRRSQSPTSRVRPP